MIHRSQRPSEIRASIRAAILKEEAGAVRDCIAAAELPAADREAIVAQAVDLVRTVRASAGTSVMQGFLVEYGLSTREGVALMCLAEALLRVPDTETIDALIEDKIGASDWAVHLGHSSSPLVNASTWALLLTGKVLSEAEHGLAGALHEAIRRLGEPVIRAAVAHAMRELGHHFVLGRDMAEARARAAAMEAKGYSFSYDMLGEAAQTEADARRYHLAYSESIAALADDGRGNGIRGRPGVSVKLSALHPRYEFAQRDRVMTELVARLHSLALLARSAGIGLNVDAEEADRLDLSLDVVEAVLADPALADWEGFGVVVQAYGKRAPHVIDWLYALARHLDRRIMVRLVKGAYWDSEIKRAQTLGLDGFPVFTRKAATDVSYLACTRKLLGMADRIYPQFATHNAHTMAAVLHMAGDPAHFEFQRLHGMGEALHDAVREAHGVRCRIYAPVGAHHDLLAYLVRRLLENGANSSFVNQIVDDSVTPEEIARDPVAAVERLGAAVANPRIAAPADIFLPDRRNAKGWDLTDPVAVAAIDAERASFRSAEWEAGPLVAASPAGADRREVRNPARPDDIVGHVTQSSPADIAAAIEAARTGAAAWASMAVRDRAARLRRVADLYEAHAAELFALAAREAGKTWIDCVAEVREACDFARFYASEAIRECGNGRSAPRGAIACISPWNFPLAIFSGQILGALAAGNAVVAKPAEQTPLIAARAVSLMHEAGIPGDALQLLPGDGATVGAALVSDPRIDGVCFTGSTETARRIDRAMAERLAPDAPLIAETGGLNAMIADSTALPEQAVRDIVASAFRSAGQRCSALRILYVQREIEDRILEMLFGAIDELRLGDPWHLATDIGPIIDDEARDRIESHCHRAERAGRLLKRAAAPAAGRFVPPTVLRVDGIAALGEEIFGPVLHVATLRRGGHRFGRRRCQRRGIRAHFRIAHPHRRPGAARRGPRARRKHLRQPQPDRRGRGLPALRRRGRERDRAEGRRAALCPAAARRRRTVRRPAVGRGGRRITAQGGRFRGRPRLGRPAASPEPAGVVRRWSRWRLPLRTAGPARADRRIEPALLCAARGGALPRPRCGCGGGAACGGPRGRKRRRRGRRWRRGGVGRLGPGSADHDPGRTGRSRAPRDAGRYRRRRLRRGPGCPRCAAPSVGPASGADPAADYRTRGAGALRRRAPCLRRHDGSRRQRDPARRGGIRLSGVGSRPLGRKRRRFARKLIGV